MAFDHVVLENGRYSIPMWVPRGLRGINVVSQGPSSVFAAGGGPGKNGDYEPGFAFMEQRTWEGGRGLDFFSDDQTRYNDSKGSWTLTGGKLGPAPQWFYAVGYKPNGEDTNLPGNVTWLPLYDESRYTCATYTPSANITADKIEVLVRRVGFPTGDLTLELCEDSAGVPGTVLQSVTVDSDVITDVLSLLYPFNWSGTQALTGSTPYHIKVYGASGDTRDGHWEIGVESGADGGLYSSNGTDWTSAEYCLYSRVSGVDENAYMVPFSLDGARYFVSIYEDGTNSKLFIQGARGKTTSATSTTLTDSNASFGTDDKFVGARVRIHRGTGSGQSREISAHTGTELTVAAWKITPDATSEYIIYSTNYVSELSETTGLGVVKDVAVQDNIAYFAQGASDNIRKMRFNPGATPPVHEFSDDGTNKADILEPGYHSDGPTEVMWRANNDTTAAGSNNVSRANAVTWGSNHTFGTNIKCGNGNYPITNLLEGSDGTNSRLYVFKTGENGLIQSDKWYRENLDISAFPEDTNGLAAKVHGLYKFFNWSWSLERQYGQALDDLDPNREAGFPIGRQGYISAIESHPVGVLIAIDAGDDGVSSVQFFDGFNYHEIFRAPSAGKRIRALAWEPSPSTVKQLWISCGDDLIYMEYPRYHRDPYKGDGQKFMHEFSAVSPIIDMGNSSIYKVWKELAFVTQNIDGTNRKIHVDFQTGEDVGSDTWTEWDIGEVRRSPIDKVLFQWGGVQQMRYRLRGYTNDATVPPVVNAIVVKGIGQLPIRWVISFWASFGPIADKLGASSEDAIDILANSAERATVWTVAKSIYKRAENYLVLASVDQIRPEFTVGDRTSELAHVTLVQVGISAGSANA